MALGLLLVIAGAVPTFCERGAAPPEKSLVASFTYSPNLPVEGQTMQFTDTSTGHPTRWLWDFGNGGTSLLQNPSWTFAAAGTSRVSLTVAAASLESTAAKDVVISPASSNVHEAASVSLADVRAAVESAHSGDIVRLPAGTAVWPGQLTVTKSVSLVGAGIGLTTIKGGFSGTLFQSNDCLIAYDVTDDPIRVLRVSGLSLDGEGRCEPLFIINTHPTGSPIRIRIDHCDFDDLRGDGTTGWITSWGTVYGVVDDCVFHDSVDKNGVSTICPYGSNDTSWTFTAFEFGNADNLYYENNVFYFKDQVFQGGAGGRVAVRHNTFNFIGTSTGGTVQFIDVHGNYLGGNHSSFGVELYDNTVNMGGRPVQMVDLRGGIALFYDNHFDNCGSHISSQFREESGSYRGHDANNPPAVIPLTDRFNISRIPIFGTSTGTASSISTVRICPILGIRSIMRIRPGSIIARPMHPVASFRGKIFISGWRKRPSTARPKWDRGCFPPVRRPARILGPGRADTLSLAQRGLAGYISAPGLSPPPQDGTFRMNRGLPFGMRPPLFPAPRTRGRR